MLTRATEEHNRRVVSTVPAVSGFRPETGLKWIAGLFAYGLGLSALYATTGFGLPCPFRAITGWDCPLCGGTRMGSALLHLEIGAAFAFNPLAMVALIVVGSLGVAWTVQLAGGPGLRLPARLREWSASVRPTSWLLAAAGGARRLHGAPQRPLRSRLLGLVSRQTRDSSFRTACPDSAAAKDTPLVFRARNPCGADWAGRSLYLVVTSV